jgi:hypothetical protein
VPFPRCFRVFAPRHGEIRVLPSSQAMGAPAFMRGSAGFSPRERSPQTTSGFSRGHFNLDVDSAFTPAPQKTQNFSSRYLASASTLRRPKSRIPFAPQHPRAFAVRQLNLCRSWLQPRHGKTARSATPIAAPFPRCFRVSAPHHGVIRVLPSLPRLRYHALPPKIRIPFAPPAPASLQPTHLFPLWDW